MHATLDEDVEALALLIIPAIQSHLLEFHLCSQKINIAGQMCYPGVSPK